MGENRPREHVEALLFSRRWMRTSSDPELLPRFPVTKQISLFLSLSPSLSLSPFSRSLFLSSYLVPVRFFCDATFIGTLKRESWLYIPYLLYQLISLELRWCPPTLTSVANLRPGNLPSICTIPYYPSAFLRKKFLTAAKDLTKCTVRIT